MPRFSRDAEEILRRYGWFPGREIGQLLLRWKQEVLASDGFEMFAEAERVLSEFGELNIDQQGPGITAAREPFVIDPTWAMGLADRFSEFSEQLGTSLYPLGEAACGNLFLAIGEDGRVFLLMEEIYRVYENIEQALESLILGIGPDSR